MNYSFRKANLDDVEFISRVIIEAEKSGSHTLGLARIFNLEEAELQNLLINILNEEIEGCEFSVNSYVIAENKGLPVAAFGGWIEGRNENQQASTILKSNLIGFTFPKEKLILPNNLSFLKHLQITREPNVHQLEYAYVHKNHRGQNLVDRLIDELITIGKQQYQSLAKSQVQVYENNLAAIKVYERCGYSVVKRVESNESNVLDYLPWNAKLIMEKNITP